MAEAQQRSDQVFEDAETTAALRELDLDVAIRTTPTASGRNWSPSNDSQHEHLPQV